MGQCPECGKKRYTSRKIARKALRQMNSGGYDSSGMNEYRCGEYWHVGHLPRRVVRGRRGRDQI